MPYSTFFKIYLSFLLPNSFSFLRLSSWAAIHTPRRSQKTPPVYWCHVASWLILSNYTAPRIDQPSSIWIHTKEFYKRWTRPLAAMLDVLSSLASKKLGFLRTLFLTLCLCSCFQMNVIRTQITFVQFIAGQWMIFFHLHNVHILFKTVGLMN